jgi:hypothetical protein
MSHSSSSAHSKKRVRPSEDVEKEETRYTKHQIQSALISRFISQKTDTDKKIFDAVISYVLEDVKDKDEVFKSPSPVSSSPLYEAVKARSRSAIQFIMENTTDVQGLVTHIPSNRTTPIIQLMAANIAFFTCIKQHIFPRITDMDAVLTQTRAMDKKTLVSILIWGTRYPGSDDTAMDIFLEMLGLCKKPYEILYNHGYAEDVMRKFLGKDTKITTLGPVHKLWLLGRFDVAEKWMSQCPNPWRLNSLSSLPTFSVKTLIRGIQSPIYIISIQQQLTNILHLNDSKQQVSSYTPIQLRRFFAHFHDLRQLENIHFAHLKHASVALLHTLRVELDKAHQTRKLHWLKMRYILLLIRRTLLYRKTIVDKLPDELWLVICEFYGEDEVKTNI